jgi:micrococcal nuclease
MKKFFTIALIIAFYIAARYATVPIPNVNHAAVAEPPAVTSTPEGYSLVTRTVDGDTFVALVDGEEEKVRMVGMDTPESVDPRKPVQCFAHEASARLKELIAGRAVKLVPDAKSADKDKYGRLLRYVYMEDGTFINAEMISEGYARAYTKFRFEKPVEFLKLQSLARAAGRGLWSPTTCNGGR